MSTPRDTGLALDAPELDDIITDTTLGHYRGARLLLAEAIPRAVAAGYSANQIAARLSGVFGRQAVVAYVTAIRTAETVGKLLPRTELRNVVSVGYSGPDSPVGAWVVVSADRDQMHPELYMAMPIRVRQMLALQLLTTDPKDDSLLLAGKRVYIEKMQPKV